MIFRRLDSVGRFVKIELRYVLERRRNELADELVIVDHEHGGTHRIPRAIRRNVSDP